MMTTNQKPALQVATHAELQAFLNELPRSLFGDPCGYSLMPNRRLHGYVLCRLFMCEDCEQLHQAPLEMN